MRNEIDFIYIFKKIHHLSDKQEENILKEWMDSDKKHAAYFKSAQNYYSPNRKILPQKDVKDQLRKVKYKLFWSPVIKRTLKLSAIWTGLLLLSGILFWMVNTSHPRACESDFKLQKDISIILSDGSICNTKLERTFSEQQTKLSLKNNTAIYTLPKKEKLIPRILSTLFNKKYNQIWVPRQKQFKVVLADSTVVWLNSETSIKYPVIFNKNKRIVELSGEACFIVKHNPSKPFFVKTNNQEIKVLGTQFNVTAYPDNDFVTTTLIKGSVEITTNNNKTLLSPNQQLIFNKKNNKHETREINATNFSSWKDGKYIFRKEPIGSIMHKLSKWYNFRVVFKNEKIKRTLFTASFNREDSFEKVLTIIGQTNEIKFKINGKNVIIY